MKLIISILLCILSASIGSYANGNKPKERPIYVELEQTDIRNQSKGRPRCPVKHNEIECFYQNGYLHISFECPEGNAILSISDITDTPCLTQPFSSSVPFTIYIGEIEFPLVINITTDSCIYEGILSF